MANVVITFVDEEKNCSHDLVVPDEISADEFIDAMHKAYKIYGRTADSQRFMRMEYPIGLLKGERSLRDLGMRNGAVVYSGKRG